MKTGRIVVDTNVLIVANGRSTHADEECQLSCIKAIIDIEESRIVVLDSHDLIFDEYKNHFDFSGEPGVGDRFFKYIFNHRYSTDRVLHVPITKAFDGEREFKELPPNSLDRSDQKFLATAVVADATILNAVDNDWHTHHALIQDLGVLVSELCPQHLSRLGPGLQDDPISA